MSIRLDLASELRLMMLSAFRSLENRLGPQAGPNNCIAG